MIGAGVRDLLRVSGAKGDPAGANSAEGGPPGKASALRSDQRSNFKNLKKLSTNSIIVEFVYKLKQSLRCFFVAWRREYIHISRYITGSQKFFLRKRVMKTGITQIGQGFNSFNVIWYVIIISGKRSDEDMTPALQKMWISFIAMGFMVISIFLIYLSRYKLKGFWRVLTAIIAYILMILAGLIILIVVLSGPTT